MSTAPQVIFLTEEINFEFLNIMVDNFGNSVQIALSVENALYGLSFNLVGRILLSPWKKINGLAIFGTVPMVIGNL